MAIIDIVGGSKLESVLLLLGIVFASGTFSSVLTFSLLRRHLARAAPAAASPVIVQDPATRIFSSDAIYQFFETKRAKAAQRPNNPDPISFILLDVDNFKRINTQFGMEGGDRLVAEVAGLLKANTRGADDALFRYKFGDEFLILCYGATGTIAAERIAPRISELISSHDFYLSASADEIRITVSIGVTEYHPEESFDQMTRRLETALRRAKERKDHVVLL